MMTTLTAGLLAVVFAEQAAAQSGIWTGHDWVDGIDGIQDSNGILSGTSSEMRRRLESASVYGGNDLSDVYLDLPNVQMVQSVLSRAQWEYLFPEAISLYDYDSFLQAVGKFPKFCLEGDANLCKRELSTFFAHTTHECGKESPNQTYPEWRQGFYFITENACTPSVGAEKCDYKSDNWSSIAWPPQPNVQYFGRGPFQLSWNYNYGPFSQIMFGDVMVLLENPDFVQTDGYTAFASALWFYMTPQAPKPSMHEVAAKLFVPNADDVSRGLGDNFGATIMIINGALECTTKDGQENSNASLRRSHYTNFLSYFGLPAEDQTLGGCATTQPFGDAGASNYAQSLDKNWDVVDECKVVPWTTQFTIFRELDYKECVCQSWAPGQPNCLAGNSAAVDESAPQDQITQ